MSQWRLHSNTNNHLTIMFDLIITIIIHNGVISLWSLIVIFCFVLIQRDCYIPLIKLNYPVKILHILRSLFLSIHYYSQWQNLPLASNNGHVHYILMNPHCYSVKIKLLYLSPLYLPGYRYCAIAMTRACLNITMHHNHNPVLPVE